MLAIPVLPVMGSNVMHRITNVLMGHIIVTKKQFVSIKAMVSAVNVTILRDFTETESRVPARPMNALMGPTPVIKTLLVLILRNDYH